MQLFVPDLAIEIVSANDKFAALVKKAKSTGAMAQPKSGFSTSRSVRPTLYSAGRDAVLNENEVFSSSQIPGFSIRLGELFDRTNESRFRPSRLKHDLRIASEFLVFAVADD